VDKTILPRKNISFLLLYDLYKKRIYLIIKVFALNILAPVYMKKNNFVSLPKRKGRESSLLQTFSICYTYVVLMERKKPKNTMFKGFIES
jgi:hypothetical protein